MQEAALFVAWIREYPGYRTSVFSCLPHGTSWQVLLTTYACGALGLNLHESCSRIALVETPLNTSTQLQAIGRAHHVGQRERQKVWIPFQDHTIQRFL
ncbi:uncharacterized protein BJX67DRAFT_342200 [Aspergillus lucknowensis]|uniref:Helicase C-terminal domain-containing protein n=1 Tax=Aspergillus lucknowensis TaxID=176173 RepID=A0ABR4M4B1_9EURO